MGLSPLWAIMTTHVSACGWTHFSVSWTHTWKLCCSGGVENTAILPSRFPVFLLASLETCCGYVPPAMVMPSRFAGVGGAISSSNRVLLQPCLGTGTAAGRPPQLELPEQSPCLHGRLSLPLPLSVSPGSISLSPEGPAAPSALWLSPTAGLVVTRRWSRKALGPRPGG